MYYGTLEALKKAYSEDSQLNYLFFWGHQQGEGDQITKSCLSQWYQAYFTVEDIVYCCMEQYMMAEKARLFHDEEIFMRILKEQDPKEIKALGRKISTFDEVQWKGCCQGIVRKGNLAKFQQNQNLGQFLIDTEDRILVEASPYDQIWGIGMSEQEKEAANPLLWKGTNYLGFALMWVREQLKEHGRNVDISLLSYE